MKGRKSDRLTAMPRSANIAMAASLMSASESVSTPSMSKMTAAVSTGRGYGRGPPHGGPLRSRRTGSLLLRLGHLGLADRTLVARLVVEAVATPNDVARVVVPLVCFDGHEGAAIAELLVVVLRLHLGDTEADERTSDPAGDPAGDRAGGRTGEGGPKQPAWDHRAEARNEGRRAGA